MDKQNFKPPKNETSLMINLDLIIKFNWNIYIFLYKRNISQRLVVKFVYPILKKYLN